MTVMRVVKQRGRGEVNEGKADKRKSGETDAGDASPEQWPGGTGENNYEKQSTRYYSSDK